MTMRIAIGLAAVLLALTAPMFVYPVFLMKALCFALFAAALNLLLGYAGFLSFGHAALFGGAAYVAGHSMKIWGFPPELGLLTGAATGALLGFGFGALASRCQGVYFAMVTFALAQLVYFAAVQAPFTGGEDGLQSIPRGHLFGVIDLGPTLTLYYVILVVFVAAMLAMHRIVHSPFGLVLRTIRDNEPRAVSLGYSSYVYKVVAFTLSGMLSGLAGAMKTLVFQMATLTDVYWHTNGEVVLMTVLGGIGTLLGPALGAFIVVAIQSYFAEAGAWVTIIQGVVFVVMVLAFRRGIVGELAAWFARFRGAAERAGPNPARSDRDASDRPPDHIMLRRSQVSSQSTKEAQWPN
ncbi:MAG: branched-chain amino acid ABC transporter permease [Parvibaculaceae bacterium]